MNTSVSARFYPLRVWVKPNFYVGQFKNCKKPNKNQGALLLPFFISVATRIIKTLTQLLFLWTKYVENYIDSRISTSTLYLTRIFNTKKESVSLRTKGIRLLVASFYRSLLLLRYILFAGKNFICYKLVRDLIRV